MPQTAGPSAQAQRFLPMVKSLAEAIRLEFNLVIPLEELIAHGTAGLEDAVSSFRRGHGTSFRDYAQYRISTAIYQRLQETHWPSSEAQSTYRFHQRTNEFMEWYSCSSESMMKRTLDSEISELNQILRVLLASYFLGFSEMKETTRESIERSLQSLEPGERSLVSLCFSHGRSLEDAARQLQLTTTSAARLQLGSLRKIAAEMTGSAT